jgi:N-acetylneuraminic acid mutarotase
MVLSFIFPATNLKFTRVTLSVYPILISILLLLTSVSITNYFDSYLLKQLDSIEASMSEFSWTRGASMPSPGAEASSVILGNKIYIIGGEDADKKAATNIVRIYDPNTDSWSASAPLPIPLDHTGSAAHNGKIYVVGGFTAEGKKPTDTLFIYDPDTNKWQRGKPLPGPRGALTADFINGTLYAIGGLDASHTPVGTNEAYDPKTNTWTEKAPMPTARHHHTSVAADGKLYVIGGRLLGNSIKLSHIDEALSNFNDNEMYNPLNDSWTVMEQMPTKRSGIAAAVSPVDGNIYVFGGQDIEGAFSNTERFNPKINKWSSEEPVPTARYGLEAIALDDKIYVIGGRTNSGPYLVDINEVFNVDNNSTRN